ncbi:transcriptional regulator, TetR family [Streptoalloteichus tenebrarius]|uniref:Transcriptional regulator, TetR family n=1 Tax=Streptoalloteichus tenebrarius (strain ATCC 17920 / DSM 40477 / JCM 4838 / CBS 697.72 / NBRC 16177 / NCIMB 11028 / NRRL B-12390 / A12253. 1 / ISP 5477) TaxID=1933 RepID=A0ABT1I0Y3_STRSD|nr:TetR/AcrR family transcriptional regulator [Streptoalloteichus tenebrarius]MCP2261448.1 transcriptional regulator, TetR family [Streptoalloteichus tenebrarius]
MRGTDESPAPDGRRDRWREHRRARREALVDTALAVIDRLGPDWGMGDMARAAGVSKPVLYRYFRDRTDLDDAVCARGVDLLRRRLPPPDDPAEPASRWLVRLTDAYLAVLDEHRQLYRCLAHAESCRAPSGDGNGPTTVLAVVRDLVHRHMTARGATGPVDLWSQAVAGLVVSAGEWWLAHEGTGREWAARQVGFLAAPALAAVEEPGEGGGHPGPTAGHTAV